jgi:DNA-binding GntR family transcriptional regulator
MSTGTELAPIQPRYLRDAAFEQLRDAIVAGVLAPGAPIVIDDLASAFGLSTMPVREAVKRLVADGLVEELPRRAHRVAPLTRASALNTLEVMETLMVRAYEIAAPLLRPEDVERMRGALDDAAARAARDDLVGALRSVHAMHGVIYDATGNPEFARALSSIVPRFDRVLVIWYTESIKEVGRSYRAEMIEALAAGDAAGALELMRGAWTRFREIVAGRDDA